MALRSLLDEFVIIDVNHPFQPDESSPCQVISISASEISSWDLSEILCYRRVKVRAHRTRLIQESSYFHGLLSGSFSESGRDHVSVEWNQETFLNLLRCIYDCATDITSISFLPLFDAALYFGVERLLSKCKSWLSVLASSKDHASPQLELSDLIQMWSFGLERAVDFVPDLCAAYLAKNLMLVKSDQYFGNVPYELLMCGIKHPHLTVHSEMHLADALLVWLDADKRMFDLTKESNKDNIVNLMEQVRFSLLPLWFIAERSKSHGFSKFADQSIELVIRLTKMSSKCLVNSLRDGPPADISARLTEYSERLDLSGCAQLNEAILLLSVLPKTYFANPMWRKSFKSLLTNPEDDERNREQLSQRSLPVSSFETVEEVDISKCTRLDYKVAIKCFSKSFPSLRKLRAAYLLNIKVSTVLELLQKFPQLTEVDLTVDIVPVIPGQASVFYSSPGLAQTPPIICLTAGSSSFDPGQGHSSLSNITRLTLEGRIDIYDTNLRSISRLCVSLCYLNIKGCALLSDACIAYVIKRCKKLHSLIVCYTSFSENSILALCAGTSVTNEHMDSNPLASNLQILHMSKCEGISETSLLNLITWTHKMKSLCLRDTKVSDTVLFEFSGSSLEALDVSNTTISSMALARVISKNPNLKSLKAKGCKNLLQLQIDGRTDDFSPLFNCLSKGIGLEELEIGWGFSYFSFESLRPAVSFLRAIIVGLGASLGEYALKLLPSACPLLESIVLCFQEISDSALTSIVTSLKHLEELALSYCFGDISLQSFKFSMPNLRKLRLERVTRWMTNDDLYVLTQSCPNLTELSLVGCLRLNSDSQPIISTGWPGMISLHLEECGSITENGVASLYGCIALEDLLLRHNLHIPVYWSIKGSGLQKNFLLDAALKFPMLRLLSLDMCDAKDGNFDVPEENDQGRFLSIVKISRCKSQRCALGRELAPVHRETLVMFWNGQNFTKTLLKQRLYRGFFTEPYWFWICIVALLGFSLLFNLFYIIALTYLNPLGNSKATVVEEGKNKKKGNNRGTEDSLVELSSRSSNGSKRGMVLPFQPLSLAFNNVNYYVDMPAEMKAQGIEGDRLQLLRDVGGAFRPGILTALVGVSGAGKTTLMDVLAGRKTGGYVEGSISISGYPKNQSTFARVSGYCEQNDIHSPHVTVYESLIYSAWLRLSADIDAKTREMFVEEVMELVELKPLRNSIVGLPGVDGLSTEQRKRLTIAVELVANPSIIFMDEPTSGLDARAAAIVMRTVRNTVDTGRTVVCTIHQPSIDIFESFDELLLMKRGGQVIYAGSLGHHSQKLIEYFEAVEGVPRIKDGYNPATWMLDVTTPSMESQMSLDFAQLFANSSLYRRNQELIKELSTPPLGSKDLYFRTKYSQPFLTQIKACFWKQYWSNWRYPQYNAIRFLMTVVIGVMFGLIFRQTGTKIEKEQDLNNFFGAMYAAILFLGATNAATVQPAIAIERTVFYREKAAGMYSAIPYAISRVAVEIMYNTIQTGVYTLILYSMIGYDWTVAKFFWFYYYMLTSFIYFTLYGMMLVALTPNYQIAGICMSFFLSLWNLFSGFFIPRPQIPVWWRWYYWATPVAWTLYGIITFQVGDQDSIVHITGVGDTSLKTLLKDGFGFEHDFLPVVAAVHIAWILLFIFVFAYGIKFLNFQRR